MTQALETLLIEALSFYANGWEQDVDAELTPNGWVGTIGEVEPTAALRKDLGAKARDALTAWNTRKPCDAGSVETVVRDLAKKLYAHNVIKYDPAAAERCIEAAIASIQPCDAGLREALSHYAAMYCEGWCEEVGSGGMYGDCGGCIARIALSKGDATR